MKLKIKSMWIAFLLISTIPFSVFSQEAKSLENVKKTADRIINEIHNNILNLNIEKGEWKIEYDTIFYNRKEITVPEIHYKKKYKSSPPKAYKTKGDSFEYIVHY